MCVFFLQLFEWFCCDSVAVVVDSESWSVVAATFLLERETFSFNEMSALKTTSANCLYVDVCVDFAWLARIQGEQQIEENIDSIF